MAIWPCGYVAMWLCGYVALWLCGYVVGFLKGLQTQAQSKQLCLSCRIPHIFKWNFLGLDRLLQTPQRSSFVFSGFLGTISDPGILDDGQCRSEHFAFFEKLRLQYSQPNAVTSKEVAKLESKVVGGLRQLHPTFFNGRMSLVLVYR